MKRLKRGTFEQVISIENLRMAEYNAYRSRKNKPDAIRIHEDSEKYIQKLHDDLASGSFRKAAYRTFKKYSQTSGKIRDICELRYYPEVIIQYAIANICEPVWRRQITTDVYCGVKGRGGHQCSCNVYTAVKTLEREGKPVYALKIDIRKFYESVDHDVMMQRVSSSIKDVRLLSLIEVFVRSYKGLGIGWLLSNYFQNVYLAGFDNYVKQVLKVRYYFRYCDDMVFISGNKAELHALLVAINDYLYEILKLDVKSNYQVFPVAKRGIDFCGFVVDHTGIRLRKSIKVRMKRRLRIIGEMDDRALTIHELSSYHSYMGFLTNCTLKYKSNLKQTIDYECNGITKRIERLQDRKAPKA